MHRLRTRKKTKGEDDDAIPSVPALPHNMGFLRKGKPAAPPEPPQVDLEHALPSSDDFRTSLLMPNLAQRFSILKQEQLAAQAAAGAGSFIAGPDIDGHALSGPEFYSPSRFVALGDIAETASIDDGSVASAHNRLTTRSDERRPSEDGSVMNRSRGGEGNVLFGGRQKIYKVAGKALRGGTSSMEDLQFNAGFGGGRSVSQNDPSDPQHHPQHHSSRPPKDDDLDCRTDDAAEHNNRNRYTSSSTNSTPTTMTRSSTAATSINSQPGHSAFVPTPLGTASLPQSPTATMATNKPRRPLYEQALDQQLQDQQSTAMGRLERLASLRRMGTASPPRSGSPVAGSSRSYHASPTSPTSRQAMPWASNRASPSIPLSPLSPPAEEAEMQKDLGKPPKSAVFDTFDFGLGCSPISPPMTSKGSEFPTKGPFSPSAFAGDRSRQRSPERISTPASEQESSASLGASSDNSPRNSGKQEFQETFLRSYTSSDRSSMDQDLVIQNIGDELDDAARVLRGNMLESPSPDDDMFQHRADPAAPDHGSPAAGASPMFDGPARDFLDALRPLASPTSSKFAVGASEDGSPALSPPGQGLSLLVRQHLRSDSGSSSVYASSTYTRVSRVSRYGVAASITKVGAVSAAVEPRASGSSAGNIWQYDESDGDDYHDEMPMSPSSIYSPGLSIAPPMFHSGQETSRASPGHFDLSLGRRSEDEGGKSTDDWERGRGRTESRAGTERAESRAGTERANSRAGTEHSVSRDEDQDWKQELAFRRQIVQQNLRDQEKIQSQHEMPFENPQESPGKNGGNGGGTFGGLKTKPSNSYLRNEGVKTPPVIGMGLNGSHSPRPDSKGRGWQDTGRVEEETRLRNTVRGPHPMSQPPHQNQRHQHPALNTSQSFGNSGDRSAEPRSAGPRVVDPSTRSRTGPTPNLRARERAPHENMNGGTSSGASTPRGHPTGWRDNWGSTPENRSQPTSQAPQAPYQKPMADGYKDDLSRAMMTGQSNIAEVSPVLGRRGRGGEGVLENVKSTFEIEDDDDDRRPSTFRRPRGNSLVSSGSNARQKGTSEAPPLPQLNTATLGPPPNQQASSLSSPSVPSPSPSPSPAAKSPAAVMQQIQSANAVLVPVKKRAVNKLMISEPKLLHKTSSIPTINLPTKNSLEPSTPFPSATVTATPTRGRKRTNTVFGGFGKNKTAEDLPDMPPNTSEDKPRRNFSSNRLRKSTSDGGALASRARMDGAAAMREQMPKIQMPMRMPMSLDKEAGGGMI